MWLLLMLVAFFLTVAGLRAADGRDGLTDPCEPVPSLLLSVPSFMALVLLLRNSSSPRDIGMEC
jgi:hypothetical protein